MANKTTGKICKNCAIYETAHMSHYVHCSTIKNNNSASIREFEKIKVVIPRGKFTKGDFSNAECY